MQIRNEIPTDAGAIEVVTIAAFEHAPHTDHTEHFIVRALRRTGMGFVPFPCCRSGKGRAWARS